MGDLFQQHFIIWINGEESSNVISTRQRLYAKNWKQRSRGLLSWHAEKLIFIGYFIDKNDAIEARKLAEIKYHGEFSVKQQRDSIKRGKLINKLSAHPPQTKG